MGHLSRHLRTKAEQARRIARQFSGDKAAGDMLALAAELDDQADTIDASGGDRLRRVIYKSVACSGVATRDLDAILVQSRVNNGLDGISGLLCSDGEGFLQLLEGPPDSIEKTFARILADKRHHQVHVVSDEIVDERAFGDWSMAHLPPDRGEAFNERMRVLLAGAPATVRAVFAPLTRSA